MNLIELESLYLKAKETYYAGNPIMSDDEFDILEETLRNQDSKVVEIVGVPDRTLKHNHLSPMISLAKIQASLSGEMPLEQAIRWFSKFPEDIQFEASAKYDGNGVNLIYRDGKLDIAITRGNKLQGRDVTNKLKLIVPNWIDVVWNDVEIRGEVVIKKDIFYSKYSANSEYKNPRNFVAGILNKDEINPNDIGDLEFLPVEVRRHEDGDYDYPIYVQDWLTKNKFKPIMYLNFYPSEFESVYTQMLNYRDNESPYQLDGFVIKAPGLVRKQIGETSHHPNWAIAVKFPPKAAKTRVTGIEWNIGSTGEFCPVISLSPVDLDGSTVSNTSGYNYGYIVKNKVYPGSEVIIAKAGDIIPQIQSIVSEGLELFFEYPKICPVCGTLTEIDNIHLICPNEQCEGKLFKKFLSGFRSLSILKFGIVVLQNIYDAGFKSAIDVFDESKFNKKNLIESGFFKEGKALDNLFIELNKVKSLEYYQVILSLGFEGIGETAAKQLAKKLNNQEYSFSNLEREPLNGFEIGEWKYELVQKFIAILKQRNISIEIESTEGIGCEFTGSPKEAGFKTKSDLLKFINKYGYVHQSLKTAKLLLTDSLDSTSSKMETARKNGIEIMTYQDFIEKFK